MCIMPKSEQGGHSIYLCMITRNIGGVNILTYRGSIKENIIKYGPLVMEKKMFLAFNLLDMSKSTVRFYVPAIYGQNIKALNYSSKSKNWQQFE